MKRTVLVTVMSLGLFAPAALAAGPGATGHPRGINARQENQKDRIQVGVKSGELTKGELDKLKADEAGIRAEERVYRNSGGGLDKAERKDLEKDLDRTSKEIYKLKHNDRVPGGGK